MLLRRVVILSSFVGFFFLGSWVERSFTDLFWGIGYDSFLNYDNRECIPLMFEGLSFY